MRIFVGELTKNFFNKTIWFLLLSFLALSVFLFAQKAHSVTKINSDLIDCYSDIPVEDAIILARNQRETNDLIMALQNFRSIYQDEKLIEEAFLEYVNTFYGDDVAISEFLKTQDEVDVAGLAIENVQLYYLITQLEYIESYYDFISSMEQRTQDMLKSSLFNTKKSFALRNILKTQSDFENMKTIKLSVGNDSGIVTVSNFIYADILLIAFVFVLCYYIFSVEREQGLLKILKVTVRGRLPVIFSKIIILLLLTIMGFSVIYGSVIFMADKMLGFGDLSRYIQSISAFRDCPVALTVGGYLLCFLSIKLSVILLVALILALFFQLSKSSTLIYLLILGFSCVEYLLYILIHPASVLNLLKYINIFSFLDTFSMFKIYTNINLFGYPCGRVFLTIVSAIIALILLTVINLKLFTLRWQGFTMPQFIHKLFQRKKKSSGSVSLLYHEFYKTFFTSKRFIAIIALLVISYASVDQSPLYMDRETSSYLTFINKYEGVLTKEKTSLIQEEIKYINSIPNRMVTISEDYKNGDITKEKYQKEFNLLQFDFEKNIGFSRFEKQFEYLDSLNLSSKPGIVSEVSSDYLFNNVKRDYIYAIYIIILIIICTSCIFPIDSQSGMENILRCTVGGEKKLFYIKTLTATLISTILFIWINFVRYLNMFLKYRISDVRLPIQSIQKYANIDVEISIAGFIIFVSLLTLLTVVMITQIIILLSLLLRKQSLVILCASVLFLIPLLLGYIGIPTFDFLSINNSFQLYQTIADSALNKANIMYFMAVGLISIGVTLINVSIYRKKI
jgi:hypothetical protein